MKLITLSRIFAILFSAMLMLSSSLAASKPAAAQSSAPPIIPGARVILRADPHDNFFRVPAPAIRNRVAAPTATINVTYIGSWDAQAQAAFQYAVEIWESLIISAVPIEVEAEWTDLGPGVLGAAGPNGFVPGSSLPQTYYPLALANALAGADLNAADSEIGAEFSSSFANWYFGLDGNTPSGKYDFATVVLHELGHGLGFLGSADVSGGVGSYGLGPSSTPIIYDRFIENGTGTPLLSFPNPSTQLGNQLRGGGGGLFFAGPQTTAANGGTSARIYTPAIWQSGSSYSHLDEDTFNNTVNALMTYAVGQGESLHAPGPVTLGMFQDMGWGISSQVVLTPDLSITQVTPDTILTPGAPITLTLSIANNGTATAPDVTVTDILSGEIMTTSWTASPSLAGIADSGGPPYSWDLPDLAVGAAGVINVYGTVDPNLNDTSPLIIEATISTTSAETNLEDNSSSVIFGGVRVYLPLVRK